MVDEIREELAFSENTSPTGVGDPADEAETPVAGYPTALDYTSGTGNTVVSTAATSFNGDADYFIDVAVPLADIQAELGTGPLYFMAGTSNNARSLSVDLAGCDDSGTCTLADAASDLTYLDGTPVPDSDNDGLYDTEEDVDGDGDYTNDDSDGDGLANYLDEDDDEDGLPTAVELSGATDHLDDDSDEDGLLDGTEDADADGIVDTGETDPTAFDTDTDGLSDGLESGLASPEGSSTDTADFVADSDPATTTDPTVADSDRDTLSDGAEDSSGDGEMDPGETDPDDADTDDGTVNDGVEVGRGTDPLDPSDDVAPGDSDGDGLTDDIEAILGTDPNDDDSDDDGLLDGVEDANQDGSTGADETDPMAFDSDADGLGDGQESGLTTAQGYDTDASVFVADADPATTTDPLNEDSDSDTLLDGDEDNDHDGSVGAIETDPANADTDGGTVDDGTEVGAGMDPLDPSDDVPPVDSDGDGLTDDIEVVLGTDPDDDDSDDEGLLDGTEDADHDGNTGLGETDPTAFDSDGDGLGDGQEAGLTAAEGSDTDGGTFVADGDPTTTTDPTEPDSDGDTLLDGDEDADHDGAVGATETDPDNADTDGGTVDDGTEVGAGKSGAMAELPAGNTEFSTDGATVSALVPPGGTATVELKLPAPRGSLAVEVVDAAGKPIPGAQWAARGPLDVPLRSAGTLSVRPGDYELTGRAEGYRTAQARVTVVKDGSATLRLEMVPAKASLKAEKIEIKDSVYFETGKTVIKAESFSLLDEVAEILNDHPELSKIRIEGNTDSRGSAKENLKLSQGRAEAVKTYLAGRKVAPERLDAIGYGESKPLVKEKGPADQAKNRRVDFVVAERTDGAVQAPTQRIETKGDKPKDK